MATLFLSHHKLVAQLSEFKQMILSLFMKGQLLIQLDPIDSFIAFEQAKANLGQVVRSTQQLFINNKGLKANIEDRQILLNQARSDLKRRDEAIGIGAVSKEELTHAQDSFKVLMHL